MAKDAPGRGETVLRPHRGVASKEVAELFRERQEEAARTRTQLLREELSDSLDHAVKAAGHAAGGLRAAGVQMAPAASRFRDAASQRWEATVAAFNDTGGMSTRDIRAMKKARKLQRARRMQQARGPLLARTSRRRRRRSGRRMPRMMGLLAAGMAVGAATAMVLRRRRQQWEEYDATEALETVGAAGAAAEAPPGAVPGGMPDAGPMAEGAPMAEGGPLAEGPEGAEGDVYGTGEPGAESVDDLVSRTQGSRRRSRG
jgi:hypothetical protein